MRKPASTSLFPTTLLPARIKRHAGLRRGMPVMGFLTALATTSLATTFAWQSESEFETRIEELKRQQALLEDQLNDVREELAAVERALGQLKAQAILESRAGIAVATSGRTPLFDKPTEPSKQTTVIPKGEKIIVVRAASSDRFQAIYGDLTGFVSTAWLDRSDSNVASALDGLIADYVEKEQRSKQEKDNAGQAERLARLTKKYGSRDAERILKQLVWMGMTADQLTESWGKPQDINTTTTIGGTREQWVYSIRQYVYLEDGRVTAWQQ